MLLSWPRPWPAPQCLPVLLHFSTPAPAGLLTSWGLWKVQPITLFPKGLFSPQRRKHPGLIRYPASCRRTDCSENLSQKSRGWEVTLRSPQSSEGLLGVCALGATDSRDPAKTSLPGKGTRWLKPLSCTIPCPHTPSPPPPTCSLANLFYQDQEHRGPDPLDCPAITCPGLWAVCLVPGAVDGQPLRVTVPQLPEWGAGWGLWSFISEDSRDMSNSGGRTRRPQSRSSCKRSASTRHCDVHGHAPHCTLPSCRVATISIPHGQKRGLRLGEVGGSNDIQVLLSTCWAPRTV